MKYWRHLSLRLKAAVVASCLFSLGILATILVVVLTRAEFHQQFSPLTFLLLHTSFALLLIFGISYALTYFFINRPLENLIKIMEGAEKKDFLIRAPVRSQDVIGRLSDCFNRLMERMTTIDAVKLETERKLIHIEEELAFKKVLEEKNKRLSFLYEVAHTISATIDLASLLTILSDIISQRLGFKEFAILLWDAEQEALVVRHMVGFKPDVQIQDMLFKKGEGISGLVAKTQQMIYIPDTRQDDRYLHYKGQKKEDVSFVSIPLLAQNKLIGVMNLSRPGMDEFSKDDLALLQAIADQVGVALNNAHLYSTTQSLTVKDELTDLHNRRYLQQALPLEIKRAERYSREFSILMIDIDHFKEFNDTYGHLEGDKVLQNFSKMMRQKLRESDIIARFGGDEFLIVLPNTDKKHASRVAVKLISLIEQQSFSDSQGDRKGYFTVSVGLASYPEDAKGVTDLIHRADSALYHAKREGRNKVACCQGGEFRICCGEADLKIA